MDWVSIIIPCFNGENYIDRCFKSILKQTYNLIEVIVVDDGSYDKSRIILESYEKEFSNRGFILKIIHKENGGVGSAIKTGLNHIEGKYFMTLDIDDELLKDAVYKMQYFIKTNKYKVIRANGYYIDKSILEDKKRYFVEDENEKKREYIFEDLLFYRTNNWAGSYLVDVKEYFKVTKNIEFFESRDGQNLQILLPITKKYKCGFLDVPVVNYIKNKGSYTDKSGVHEEIEMFNKFKNIRIEILKRMELLSSKYKIQLEELFLRTKLGLALNYKEKEIGFDAYKNLKKLKRVKKIDIKMVFLLKWSFLENIRKRVKGEVSL